MRSRGTRTLPESNLPVEVPVEGPLSGPHGHNNNSNVNNSSGSGSDPGLASPQQLHKESDHDATNPGDTTSASQLQPIVAVVPGTVPCWTQAQQTIIIMKDRKESTTAAVPAAAAADKNNLNPNPNPKLIKKIHQHPTLTPFRKTLYTLLLSVPPGQWTTYAALARRLDSSARAVGTAMRLNPFAPDVPCHRVLNVDGGLGGYMGTGPVKGAGGFKGKENLERKRRMLEGEGVKFDEKGRAIGKAFVDFA